MLDGLELFGMGFSWGGFESLVVPFDCAAYRTATEWKPGGPALRFHIGLEDLEDLKADLEPVSRGCARRRPAPPEGVRGVKATTGSARSTTVPHARRAPARASGSAPYLTAGLRCRSRAISIRLRT